MNVKKNEKKKQASVDALELGEKICNFLSEKKATDILLMNIEKSNSYFKYFLLATASSTIHLKSLLKGISKEFHDNMPQSGIRLRTEDVDSGWVVIDYFDLVVHLFQKETRDFYNLERLWGDAEIIKRIAGSSVSNTPVLEDL